MISLSFLGFQNSIQNPPFIVSWNSEAAAMWILDFNLMDYKIKNLDTIKYR